MALHGHGRGTDDMDILVEPSVENAERVYSALVTFGAPVHAHGVTAGLFAQSGYRLLEGTVGTGFAVVAINGFTRGTTKRAGRRRTSQLRSGHATHRRSRRQHCSAVAGRDLGSARRLLFGLLPASTVCERIYARRARCQSASQGRSCGGSDRRCRPAHRACSRAPVRRGLSRVARLA